jgi:hypothetical protein
MRNIVLCIILLASTCLCSDLNQSGIFVQVRIKESTKYGQFNDALYYTYDEFRSMSEEKLAMDKKSRVDNWVNIMDHPAPYVEPSKEELLAQQEQQTKQLDGLIDTILTKEPTKQELQKSLDSIKVSVDKLTAAIAKVK